jgi:hypothetical protein
MAQQIIELPVHLTFATPRHLWTVGKARPVAFKSGYGSSTLGLRVVYPKRFEGLEMQAPSSLLNENLLRILPPPDEREPSPDQFWEERPFNMEAGAKYLPAAAKSLVLDVLICTPAEAAAEVNRTDPWDLRERLLSLKPGLPELHEFLNRCGSWNSLTGELAHGSTRSASAHLPGEFHYDRQVIRRGLLDASAWLARGGPGSLRLTSGSEFPLSCTLKTALSAIKASVTIDHWKGCQIRVCARPDCGIPFKLQSAHKKIFHNQDCAHVASVRRGRAAKKREESVAVQ